MGVLQKLRPLNDFLIDLTQIMKTEYLILLFVLFVVDFFSGICSAFISDTEIKSKKWIDGLLRKSVIFLTVFSLGVVSAVLDQPLIFFTFFLLFVFGELKSIFENLEKIGIPGMKDISNIFDNFTKHVVIKIRTFFENFNLKR